MTDLQQEPGAFDREPREKGASDRARRSAAEIYARWEAERERSPLDHVVGAELRSRRYLNSSERRWISQALYDCVRLLRRHTWLLHCRQLADTPETRLDLISESVENAEQAAVDDAETAVKRGGDLCALPTADSPHDYIRITQSLTDAMATELEEQLGVEAVRAAEAFNLQAPTTLRLNPLRANRAQVLAALPEAAPARYSPWGVELPRRVNVYDLPGYRAGWYEVQEEASQLASLLADAQPEQVVMEIGAGAGGKTLALAAQMQNTGRIVALDTSASRLEELHRRAQRAGVRNVEAAPITADSDGRWLLTPDIKRTLKTFHGVANCVFIDSPCTGSGVLRRSPDAKWRLYDMAAFTRLQGLLLTQSSIFVAHGGVLLYVTCAFEREQNEAVIAAFLASPEGRDFAVEPALPRLRSSVRRAAQIAEAPPLRDHKRTAEEPGGKARKEGKAAASIAKSGAETPFVDLADLTTGHYMRTWPHRHNLDAFFAACLRRK